MEPEMFPVFCGVLVAARQRAVRHDSGTFAPNVGDRRWHLGIGWGDREDVPQSRCSASRSDDYTSQGGLRRPRHRGGRHVQEACPACLGEAIRTEARKCQYALKNEAGCVCVAPVVRRTDLDPNATVCLRGVEACDHISGGALLSALLEMEDGDQSLPFEKLIHSDPSSYIRADDEGHAHCIKQGDGNEQGNALMLLFCCLEQHKALRMIAGQWEAGEKLLSFSETCTSFSNHAAVEKHNIVPRELWLLAKIRSCGRGSPERRAPVAGNGRGGWPGGHRVESSPRFAWWVTDCVRQ